MRTTDPRRARERGQRAFSLVELVVLIAVLAVLAGILIPKVGDRLATSRDVRRMADIRAIQEAIELYHDEQGEYPEASRNPSHGGWDVSNDGDFIPALVEAEYLAEMPADPLNDLSHHYRYYVYDQGAYGCVGAGTYYVLGIRNFETPAGAKESGEFRCVGRDWRDEFAYVTGGGARSE